MLRVRRGVVVSAVRYGEGRDAAEQVGGGQTDQPSSRCPLYLATHRCRHPTLRHDDDRHDVADDAEPAENWNNYRRYDEFESIDNWTGCRRWKAGVDRCCR